MIETTSDEKGGGERFIASAFLFLNINSFSNERRYKGMEQTLQALYERINHNLEVITNMEASDPGRKQLVQEVVMLTEQVSKMEHEITDSYDRAERRRIDENKIQTEAGVELEKSRTTFVKSALELSKLIIPAVISAAVYLVAQKRAIIFEEEGRFVSKSSNWVGLPKRP